MEKPKSNIEKPNFNIKQKIEDVKQGYSEWNNFDLSKEIISKIQFNNKENIKYFLEEFIESFENITDSDYSVKNLCAGIISEFLAKREKFDFLEDKEIKELFIKMLQINESLQ